MGTPMQPRWGIAAACLQLAKHMACCVGTLMLKYPRYRGDAILDGI